MKIEFKPLRRYSAAIESYGFVYRPVEQILKFSAWLLMIVVFALYFKMNVVLFAIVVSLSVILIPFSFLWQYEYLFEEQIFRDFTMMIQQLIAAFKIHPKLNAAIVEVASMCTGDLHNTLVRVNDAIEKGTDFGSSMAILDEKYSFFVLENLNSLMVMVEQYGAFKYHEGLDLIQDDLDGVIEDTFLHQQELLQTKNKVFILCLLALVVGVLSKQMLFNMLDFANHSGYQMALFLFVVSLILALVLAQYSLRHSWVVWGKQYD